MENQIVEKKQPPKYAGFTVIGVFVLVIFLLIKSCSGDSDLNDNGYYDKSEVDTVFANADEAMNGFFNIYGININGDMEGKVVEITCTFTREFFENKMDSKYKERLKSGDAEYTLSTLDYTSYLNDNLKFVNDGNLLFKCQVQFNKSVIDSIINKNKSFYRAYEDDGEKITIRGKVSKLNWESYEGNGLKLNKASNKMYLVELINGYIVK